MRRRGKSAPVYRSTFGALVPRAITELISSRGVDVLRRIGIDEVRHVVADVLCGINLRDSTETLTRRRIGLLNAATFILFLRGVAASKKFIEELPGIAVSGLKNRPSKQEKWLLQWMLGLTTKGVQNILRDSEDALDRYRGKLETTNKDIIRQCIREYGAIGGSLNLDGGQEAPISWEFLLNLFCTIGSQTLAIRGSEKSTYGKLFERLVLGSVLQILGFKHVKYPPKETKNVFWLSSRIGARESDAAVLCGPGQAIRFDIGFIGRGNPEISKDKVSRFERQLEVAGKKFYVATMVIVDRIGERSQIQEQARAIKGTIIQMSMGYWPRLLAQALRQKVGHQHALCEMPESRIGAFLRKEAKKVQLEEFVEAASELIAEEQDEAGSGET